MEILKKTKSYITSPNIQKIQNIMVRQITW